MRGTVLLLAAGRGERLGCSAPKAFALLRGVCLLRRAADAASAATLVDELVVVVPPGSEARTASVLEGLGRPWRVAAGGNTRQASALAALEAAGDPPAVAVHDAARALCPPALFDVCLAALDRVPAACAGVPVVDTVKQVRDGVVVATPDRDSLVRVQTPQAFRADVYRRAHHSALDAGVVTTDDAALVERLGVAVHILPGSEDNLKITTPRDLEMAELIVATR